MRLCNATNCNNAVYHAAAPILPLSFVASAQIRVWVKVGSLVYLCKAIPIDNACPRKHTVLTTTLSTESRILHCVVDGNNPDDSHR